MSSTSNAQDLLVNVFRPTYNWSSNTGFVPSLTVSNVSEVIAGTIKTDKLAVSDVRGNTYIGSNAGALLTNLTTRENTAIGYSAMAGAINSSNNVSIGTSNFSDLTNGLSNVGIGAKTLITGTGQKNILIGTNNTIGDGSENIIIGNDLSLGNISKTFRLGSLLYGDLSSGYIGINTSRPESALDISGIVVFRNKVGFQNPDPIYSLDVAGSLYASEQIIGGKGTQSNPMYTFFDSSGSGMYIPVDPSYGTGAFAIAVNRAPAAIFSSNAVNFFQNLDVSGTFSARNIDISAFSVTNGTPSIPSVTFTNDTSTGLYLAASNRLGVTTGGSRRMEVLSNGDVSMGRLVTRDISYSGTIVGTDPNTCNVIGGVTLSNGNVILTGTSTNTNLLVPGWIRNNATSFILDISGGNISNAGTTQSSNFRASAGTAGVPAYSFASDPSTGLHSGGTSQLAFDTAGVQRMVISNGNVGIGKATPVVALEVVGDVSATTYNGPGGTQSAPHYTFSDDRTTGVFFPGANMIGLTAGGTERMRISNASIGIGTTAPANALDVSGTLRVIGTSGDLTFSNGSIRLGGATLISSTGVLSNANTTSNIIGGVTLSNTNITYAGAISNTTDSASNRIGGVTLSNTNITYAGTITGSTDNTSNSIGGVTLSNRNISYIGAISNATDSASNRIGGVTLSNTNIAYAGAILGGTDTTSNRIGGVTLSNGSAIIGGVLRNALTPSQFDISGGNISNSGQTRSSIFQGSAGSAGGPTYGFNGDPGTGLYTSSAGTLAIASGGTDRMTIDPNGTVSIVGDVSAGEIIGQTVLSRANGNEAGPTIGFFTATDFWGLYAPNTNQIGVATSGSNRMTILNTGNVGIGTTDPAHSLDVYASGVGVSNTIRVGAGVGASSANVARMRFTIAASSAALVNSDIWSSQLPAANNFGLSFGGYNDMSLVRMDMGNSRVGIRTTEPRQLLDLSGGAIQIKRPAVSTTLNSIILGDTLGTGDGFRFGIGLQGATSTGNAGCDLAINGYSDTNTQLPAANTPYVVVKRSNGFVGIGTPIPAYPLHVVGEGHFRDSGLNSGTVRIGDTAGGLILQRDQVGHGYVRALAAANLYLGTSNTNWMTLTTAGNLGLSQANPGYRLDVNSTATTAAAINASTWTRSAVSTSYYGVFAGQPVGAALAWTTCNAISSDIMEVADNSGTYFRPKVSGIYSFNVWLGGTDSGNPNVTIDVSTNSAHNVKNVANTPEIAVNVIPSGQGRASISWTGYLPNAAHFYKIKLAALGGIATSAAGGKIYVTFLGEVGSGSAQPW